MKLGNINKLRVTFYFTQDLPIIELQINNFTCILYKGSVNMAKLNDKKNFQIINIISTLIEATDHFSKLIKQNELNQSIHIFSAIVEGFSAIEKVLNANQLSKESKVEKDKIEHSLLLIAQALEKHKMIKVSEVIQFSLEPQLKRMKKIYEEEQPVISQGRIVVGVYYDAMSPRKVYPEERIDALVEEATSQQVQVVFFCLSDVNIEAKLINGEVFKNGNWKRESVTFPHAIFNVNMISRGRQSPIERKLRSEIPFTNFGLGNKFLLPKRLVKYKKFAELLVPFKGITKEKVVYDFLNDNNKAVIKPIHGRQGLDIYFVEKKRNHFSILEGKKERILGQQKFKEWIRNTLLQKNRKYIIQNYVESRTHEGEPFDIRAHVQKNYEGKWQLTKIYPRAGNKKSILSNISRGGRTESLDTFLKTEFGSKAEQYSKDLKELALDLTHHLDKLFGFALSDLGIDLTIDQSGRFWMHEVNNGPQTKYHEKDWAKNIIGYAKYVAENGIYSTNEFQTRRKLKDQFNSKTSELPVANLDKNKVAIGMLTSQGEDDKLAIACAYVANYEASDFYYFRPQDIDYDTGLIRGYFYENGEWTPKIVPYPDVIYDRLRLRGIGYYNEIYGEFEGIPITNEFYGNSISKLEVYDKLQETGELNEVIIPYQKVTRTKDILDFIERYEAVIVKPEVGSFARGVHLIEKQESGQYLVAEKDNKRVYSELALAKFLRKLLEEGTFLVQKYIETRTKEGNPFDIRVHMMKNGKNEWGFVTIYPRIGLNYATIMSMNSGGYTGKILGFLKRNYPNELIEKIEKDIKAAALKVTNIFSSLYEENFNEIAFDFALDKNAIPYLIEVNINKPGITVFEFDLARYAIPNAIHIAKQHEGMSVN